MSHWPTPLEPDGTAPVVMGLVGGSDPTLRRQAMYLVFAGRELKESGYEIEAFQQPLKRVTVPLVMRNNKGLAAAVFTYSEPWAPSDIDGLKAWIADLRQSGVGNHVPVIVVSNEAPPTPDSVPEVFQFIHWPSATLPAREGA